MLRTRPTTVEARRITEKNRREIAEWVTGWTYGMYHVRWFDKDSQQVMTAGIGDWIVRNAFGRFVQTYDRQLWSEYDRIVPAVSE